MSHTTLTQIQMRKEEQEIIDAILGNNKFLRLNLDIVRACGVEQAVFISFTLDRIKYALNLDRHFEGVRIYRDELTKFFGWSEHQQRKIENKLINQGILTIKLNQLEKIRYNTYSIDLEKLLEVIDNSSKKTGVK
jgi:hypothetical protein